jgi:hypothetical protein
MTNTEIIFKDFNEYKKTKVLDPREVAYNEMLTDAIRFIDSVVYFDCYFDCCSRDAYITKIEDGMMTIELEDGDMFILNLNIGEVSELPAIYEEYENMISDITVKCNAVDVEHNKLYTLIEAYKLTGRVAPDDIIETYASLKDERTTLDATITRLTKERDSIIQKGGF